MIIHVSQLGVPDRVPHAAQTGVTFVVHGTVLQVAAVGLAELVGAQETPDLAQVPVDDRVDTHEGRPVVVGGVEMRQVAAVGVGATGAHEDGMDGALSPHGRRRLVDGDRG